MCLTSRVLTFITLQVFFFDIIFLCQKLLEMWYDNAYLSRLEIAY